MTGPTLFVTGKLAEPALRRVLNAIDPAYEIAVLNITVAALLTTDWIGRHLTPDAGIRRVLLPGLCRGDLTPLAERWGMKVERGPADLRDLPEFLGRGTRTPLDFSKHEIEIVAEINHAPTMSIDAIRARAVRYQHDGADLIDLGCDPGTTWDRLAETVRCLVRDGVRVSVDSLNPDEITKAIDAGVELVLSVNSSNRSSVSDWVRRNPEVEFVVIPDGPDDFESMLMTAEIVRGAGGRVRLDPILEPIGFGFAASLGRYLQCRQRFPNAEIMMGVGNLTELTDVDSAGINVMLAGFCQEIGIRRVLTTEVINWARSSVKEFDWARRLVRHAVTEKVLPKRLMPELILLRDPRRLELGEDTLAELASRITDPNYRIIAERGEIHIFNGSHYLHGREPFALFDELLRRNPSLDPSHSFYLGYEFAKAVTALTLDKQYTQDRALNWGFLTVPESSPRDRHHS